MSPQLKALFTVLCVIVSLAPVAAQGTPQQPGVLTVDVAEDGTRLLVANALVSGNSLAVYGNPYLTHGYIYPAGTLSDGVSGTLRDGKPAFPERVIGAWTRWGYRTDRTVAHPQREFVVSVYELFEFDETHGGGTVLLGGVIPAEPSAAMPVLRGTGPYTCGEAAQEVLKLDLELDSLQLRYTFATRPCPAG